MFSAYIYKDELYKAYTFVFERKKYNEIIKQNIRKVSNKYQFFSQIIEKEDESLKKAQHNGNALGIFFFILNFQYKDENYLLDFLSEKTILVVTDHHDTIKFTSIISPVNFYTFN